MERTTYEEIVPVDWNISATESLALMIKCVQLSFTYNQSWSGYSNLL